ncbi:MAG: hypothetical protein KAT77_05975 [Nanoarchaeota archaeon]|nr:hypothetical protein [Nanoarchaeota archaeon]
MKEYVKNKINYVCDVTSKIVLGGILAAGALTGCGGGKDFQPESELAQLVDKHGQSARYDSEKFRLEDGWQIRIGGKIYGTLLGDKATVLTTMYDPEARKDRWVNGERTDRKVLPAIVVSLADYGLEKTNIRIRVIDEGADGKPEYAFITQSSNGRSKTVRTTDPQRVMDWYKAIRGEIVEEIQSKEDSLEFAKRAEEKQKQKEMERLLEDAEREIERLIGEGF